LYDTSGNAAEWVEDCWNDTYRNAPKDASAWTSGDCHLRVLRGGNFTSKPTDVRSPARFRYDSDVRYYANGFRILRELQ
jgi:formylglycine-generating enzyme required for sulfatase activity